MLKDKVSSTSAGHDQEKVVGLQSKLQRIVSQEVARLSRQDGVLGVGLVGSVRGNQIWEGSDIDLILVRDD